MSLKTLLIAFAAVGLLMALASPGLTWIYQRQTRMNEIRYRLDHEEIRDSARLLLASTGTKSTVPISADDIPNEIAETRPAKVRIHKGHLTIEYGDGHGHFGLRITPPGVQPQDGEPIIDGMTYYEYE